MITDRASSPPASLFTIILILFGVLVITAACKQQPSDPPLLDPIEPSEKSSYEVKIGAFQWMQSRPTVVVEAPDHAHYAIVATGERPGTYFATMINPAQYVSNTSFISVSVPVFSPDSHSIAYIATLLGSRGAEVVGKYYVLPPNGVISGTVHPPHIFQEIREPLVYSRDGTYLAYVGRKEDGWHRVVETEDSVLDVPTGKYPSRGLTFLGDTSELAFIENVTNTQKVRAVIPHIVPGIEDDLHKFDYDRIMNDRILFNYTGEHYAYLGYNKENGRDHYYVVIDSHTQKRYDWAGQLEQVIVPGATEFTYYASQDQEIHRVEETIK